MFMTILLIIIVSVVDSFPWVSESKQHKNTFLVKQYNHKSKILIILEWVYISFEKRFTLQLGSYNFIDRTPNIHYDSH